MAAGTVTLAAARHAGRFVGADLSCGAFMCPWLPGRHQDLRDAWMLGFAEGRMGFLRLADTEWPTFVLITAALRGN